MRPLLIFLFISVSTLVFGQCTTNSQQVFAYVDHMPEFPGGDSAMMSFIQKNVVYPDSARNKDIGGKVVVGFVVREDGSLCDIKILRSVSRDLDAEAMRVVNLMPKFKPGSTLKGKVVPVRSAVAIRFILAG